MPALVAACAALLGLLAGARLALVSSGGEPAHLSLHLALLCLAALPWAGVLLLARRRAPAASARQQAGLLLACALAARALFVGAPPARSDDLWRYLWDGRVQRAGLDPYAHAPDDPALAPLRDEVVWPRVAYRGLPTIYPPLAEHVFRAVARGPTGWKLTLAALDLGGCLLLAAWLRARGSDPRGVAVYALCPLVVTEVALDGHLEPLALVPLVGALWALERARPRLGGILLGLAASAKLFPALLLPRAGRRALLPFAAVAGLLAAPLLVGGSRPMPSLGTYARKWVAHAPVYEALAGGLERLLASERTRAGAPLVELPRPVATLVTGSPRRSTVFVDEAAAFLARLLCALALLGVATREALRRAELVLAARRTLGAALLLVPALHPWYLLWVLPLCAPGGGTPWLAFVALAPLSYAPLPGWLRDGTWRTPPWLYPVWFGALVATWLVERALARRALRGSAPGPEAPADEGAGDRAAGASPPVSP